MTNKKYLIIALCLMCILSLFTACEMPEPDPNYVPPEQPHLYWKDIDVVVTDVYYRRWFAGTHWHEVTVSVESAEYGIEGSCTFKGSGYFGVPQQINYKAGDVVRAQMYSWVMDSTGEVVRRSINTVY